MLPGTVWPLLTSISQTMPAHSVGEQHGAKTAPNKQLGLSYPAMKSRIQDCWSRLSHTRVPELREESLINSLLVLKLLVLHLVVFYRTHFHYRSSEGHLALYCAVSHCSSVLISIQLCVSNVFHYSFLVLFAKATSENIKDLPQYQDLRNSSRKLITALPSISINPHCFSLTSNFCWSTII